ncbi:hypothetical protein COLO4_27134 [Corchorus olitorius]|uniref:Uncharacterized protein n=1 Tax=Corchorus olitorius TaxID=93759 RepID=A0A1R3HSJ2_9ROSI|nr:hypothetical protein COLO4_27134 [Corchorus olitorius]
MVVGTQGEGAAHFRDLDNPLSLSTANPLIVKTTSPCPQGNAGTSCQNGGHNRIRCPKGVPSSMPSITRLRPTYYFIS